MSTSAPVKPRETTAAFSLPLPTRRIIFVIAAVACLTPFISAPIALVMGIILAQLTGIPFPAFFKDYKVTPRLLQYSVVGLGFGMNIYSAVALMACPRIFTMTQFGTVQTHLWLNNGASDIKYRTNRSTFQPNQLVNAPPLQP